MSVLKSILGFIFLVVAGNIVAALIAGIVTAFGIVPFEFAMSDAGSAMFSLVGFAIVLGVYSKVSG